jgi:AraC-like DNA-binding protein
MLKLIFALCAGNVLFLAFLVVTVRRTENTLANRWLALFFLLMGLFMLDDVFLLFGVYQAHPWLVDWLGLVVFALAPALYTCISQFVAIDQHFRWRTLLHFLPFGILMLLSLPDLIMTPGSKKLEDLNNPSLKSGDTVVLLLLAAQVGIYLFLSFKKLQQHQKNIESITAAPDDVRLEWLRLFLIGVTFLVDVWFVELFFLPFNDETGRFNLLYFIGIHVLGYFALKQKEVFPFSQKEIVAIGEVIESTNKFPHVRRLIVSDDELERLKIQLVEKMEVEKLYLNAEITLPALAHNMGISVHELSELVNVGFGENFSQFINRYRVEESKRLLLSDQYQHLSMVGIAFEAGFNSKTAFNTAFKKQIGMAPSEFQKQEKMGNNGQ